MSPLGEAISRVNHSQYQLPTTGVVGLLFGGVNAIDSFMTIQLYAGRRWVGWYNYPGTQDVARKFGQIAKTGWWDSLFPGPNDNPSATFGLAAEFGPGYTGSVSGTELKTTQYLGYLTAGESADLVPKKVQLPNQPNGKPARVTKSPATVTIISLPSKQRRYRQDSEPDTPGGIRKYDPGVIPVNREHNILPYWAIVPSLVSILACIMCLLGDDPICATLIIFGIVNNGVSSIVFGTAALCIRVPVPSEHSPVGDGLMYLADGNIIVLKGEEADVNIITKGEFELDYSDAIWTDKNYNAFGFVSFLLLLQALGQLLLLPFCTFFGQIMFLASLMTSGVYHLHVVSHQRESVQRDLLFKQLGAPREKWSLGTRAQMAVFVCLCVGDSLRVGESDGRRAPGTVDYDTILKTLVPHGTPVWDRWRNEVVTELGRFWGSDRSSGSYDPRIKQDKDYDLTGKDKGLLEDLIGDAWCVFSKYPSWKSSESKIWHENIEAGRGGHAGEKNAERLDV